MSNDKHDDAGGDAARKPRRSRSRVTDGAIDIREALEAPVRIRHGDTSEPIDAYEAMLRQHVKKSIVEKRVDSMKLVLREAEKHKVIKTPGPPINGGVFVVPKNLPEDLESAIFDDHDYVEETIGNGRRSSFARFLEPIANVVGFERLVRCFSGRRK
jgi:hypothetical protein